MTRGRLRRIGRRMVVDVTPLRDSSDFRWLYFGYLTGFLGRQITVVAVPYQVFVLTGSSLAVGLLGVAQLVPLLGVALVGGAIADAVDRRRLLVISQIALAITAGGLAWNAASERPQVWPLFVLSGVNAGLSAIDSPTRMAVLPSLVQRHLLSAAMALNQTMVNVGAAVGPALAGLLIARISLTATYAVEGAAFLLAALLALPIRLPMPEGGRPPLGLGSIKEGLRYLQSQRLIQGTMVIDLNAMIFGMPRALFPAIGTSVLGGDATTVGLLHAAPGTGALIGAVTSGWVGSVGRRGVAVVMAVMVWGAAIAAFGLIDSLPLALTLLALAGAADVVSAVFRGTLLQLTVPDALRGRLSAIHLAVVSGGPRLGDLEAGLVASLTSVRFSVVSGGLACVLGALVIARAIPELWAHTDDR